MANLDNAASSSSASSARSIMASIVLALTPFDNSLSKIVLIKLDESNFVLWKSIVVPIIEWIGFNRFIFGNKPSPAKFVDGSDEEWTPEYEEWF
ncbi:hypothetical protein Scep_023945 [Stephania cephalantha]|uniref:Retrotransposon Copia-like N-terminal domain-containing protein n=1 Tax=Stephania cephalantha TaxID=152367 RepID=A0AAP0HXY9_9MAGN